MIPRFRAWDKELKQMVYGIEETYDGLPYTEENKEIDLSIYNHMSCFSSWLCGCYEVMQFTGFKDKKGKEIYVGDYIKYLGKTYRVIRNFTGAFVGKMKKIGEEEVFVCYIYTECEVIGNIYENKEEN